MVGYLYKAAALDDIAQKSGRLVAESFIFSFLPAKPGRALAPADLNYGPPPLTGSGSLQLLGIQSSESLPSPQELIIKFQHFQLSFRTLARRQTSP